jgi:hypothetical protein
MPPAARVGREPREELAALPPGPKAILRNRELGIPGRRQQPRVTNRAALLLLFNERGDRGRREWGNMLEPVLVVLPDPTDLTLREVEIGPTEESDRVDPVTRFSRQNQCEPKERIDHRSDT